MIDFEEEKQKLLTSKRKTYKKSPIAKNPFSIKRVTKFKWEEYKKKFYSLENNLKKGIDKLHAIFAKLSQLMDQLE